MKKKLFNLILCFVLLISFTGCDKKDNVIKDDYKPKEEVEAKEDKPIIYTLKINKTYEDKTLMYKGRSLSEITLNTNGSVSEIACGINAGCSEYRGTYEIDGNALKITLKEFDDLGISWEVLPIEEQKTRVYEIISNDTFKIKDGNYTYTLKER